MLAYLIACIDFTFPYFACVLACVLACFHVALLACVLAFSFALSSWLKLFAARFFAFALTLRCHRSQSGWQQSALPSVLPRLELMRPGDPNIDGDCA